MDVDIKEEPPIEIEGYMLIDATAGQHFSFTEDGCSQDNCSKKRKLSSENENTGSIDASDEMQLLLHQWGLEVLRESFSKNLIDLSVLDYIVDVDIVDLCRDLPIRYRLILRHKLAEKRGKRVNDSDSNGKNGSTPLNASKFIREPQTAMGKSGRKPLQRQLVEHIPKRGRCPVDMVLNRPFETRPEEEKRLLVSMEIPRPSMPELKSTCKIKGGKSTMTRNFYRTSYDNAWWLCGSPKRNKLYCWPCLLYSPSKEKGVWNNRGFNDLNHLSATLKSHSGSQRHIDNANAYQNYGQLLATTDGGDPPDNSNVLLSGSAIASGTANKTKRSSKGNANVSSTGKTKQTSASKVKKSPVAKASATFVPLEEDHEPTANVVHQDVQLHSNKHPDRVKNATDHLIQEVEMTFNKK